jgi:hypothetical protein
LLNAGWHDVRAEHGIHADACEHRTDADRPRHRPGMPLKHWTRIQRATDG